MNQYIHPARQWSEKNVAQVYILSYDSVVMRRGAVQKSTSKLVNFFAPKQLVALMDEAVVALDLDRAKFIRAAIREKAARSGVALKEVS